jgi:hypothetical protein
MIYFIISFFFFFFFFTLQGIQRCKLGREDGKWITPGAFECQRGRGKKFEQKNEIPSIFFEAYVL